MSLYDPHAFTVLGNPVDPACPAVLRAVGGPASAELMTLAQQQFYKHCMLSRLSVVPNPREIGRLSDGTRYEIVTVGITRTMTVWPRDTEAENAVIAWTAFVGHEYLPLWDRPVIDFPTDPLPELPPEPQPPEVPIKDPYMNFGIEQTEHTYNDAGDSGGYPSWKYSSRTLQLAVWYGSGSSKSVVGAISGTSYSVWDAYAVAYNTVVSTFPTLVTVGDGETTPAFVDIGYQDYAGLVGDFAYAVSYAPPMDGQYRAYTEEHPDGIMVTESAIHVETVGAYWSSGDGVILISQQSTGLVAGIRPVAAAYNAAVDAKYAEDMAQWRVDNAEYAREHRAWENLRDALAVGSNGEYWPVIDIRKDARVAQAAAVLAHIKKGVGDFHLAARLLSFPYNVGYKSNPPAYSGGSITASKGEDETDPHMTLVLRGAGPHTMVPSTSDSSGVPTETFRLRRDVMPPRSLFGWKASGDFVRTKQFPPHHQTQPLVLSTWDNINFAFTSDYFSSTRLEKSNAAGLIVDSDAFVPPGTKLTIVVFEYRVLDGFTGEYIWTPCPELVRHDSIWLRDLGNYWDARPELPEGVDPTILPIDSVRIAAVVEQTRTQWGEWSKAQPVKRTPTWVRELYASVIRDAPPVAPTAAVIAESLSTAANPAKMQSGGFPFDATFLWDGDKQRILNVLRQPWVSSPTEQPQFIAHALAATGKVKV